MDETTTNEVVETTEQVADWDNWDDITLDDVTDEPDDDLPEAEEEPKEEAAADQPEAESEPTESATETEQPESTKPEQTADEQFTLKYMDEERKVSKDEMTTLAQKGMDYDRIRKERDEMKGERATLKSYESFLKELAGDNQSIEELMDATRAKLYANREKAEGRTVTETQALQHVQRERSEAAKAAEVAEQKANEQASYEATKQRNISAFVAKYPDVDAKSIPQSVWAKAREYGGDISRAYGEYANGQKDTNIKQLEAENAKMKAELQTLRQNQKNKERSTGSRQTSGKAMDDFDRLWYDGT